MSEIIILDKHLANQIAAGEVVERPVSVVKELIENAVDAGATQIVVEIQEGGTKLVEVRDNGGGMSKNDMELSIQKYATSKIKNLEDLYNVMTFGFRGEALASIASVCEFSMSSKKKGAPSGYKIVLESGEMISLSEIACPDGTIVEVQNLFANTPARLNYLKKPRTEYNHIYDYIQKTALSHPEIGIKFLSDDSEICNFKEGETLKERIYSIYGEEFSENILEIDFQYSGIQLTGYISDPKVFFTNKNRQALFINGRTIQFPLIFKAIKDGYNRFIPHGTFPGYVLNVTIDPTQIDVNVHPRKLEIRFAQEQSIFRLFFHGVKDILEKVSLTTIPSMRKDDRALSYEGGENMGQEVGGVVANGGNVRSPQYYTGSGTKFKAYSPYSNKSANPAQVQLIPTLSSQKRERLQPFETSQDLHDTPLGKIIGQAHNSYIILETPDGLKMLDQHALAERVIYERISKSSYTSNTQGLLIGEAYTLTPKEKDIIEENKSVFEDMGFDIELLSGNSVMVNGVPDFIKKESTKNIFFGILQDMQNQKTETSTTLEEVRNRIFAYTACRSAVKFGDKLSIFEINKLLHDAALDYSATCPHGRPVVWEMDLEEMKKKYER